MKKLVLLVLLVVLAAFISCDGQHTVNQTAIQEQAHTEGNQNRLNQNQPLPDITWSAERDNIIKLKKLQNDKTVTFFLYVFIEGISEPIGYYQVNKVSSVNSQLSNPEQIISGSSQGNNLPAGTAISIPSPSEDGSYGTNGDAIFGFTPEDICIETNMKFICATVPLRFQKPVNKLAIIDTDQAKRLLEVSRNAMK